MKEDNINMSKDYFDGSVLQVLCFGEGYYSGNTEERAVLITKDFYEEHKDTIDNYTPYFHELDGKYSEVEGECSVEVLTPLNRKCILGNYRIWDSYLTDEVVGVVCDKIKELNITISHLVNIETTTTFYFNGEEI